MKKVDVNEPWEIRQKLLELGWEQARLYSADYCFLTHSQRTVGIERKAVSDLLGSLDGRLSAQLEKMTESYDYKILLLEGSWREVSQKVVTEQGISRWLMSTVWNFIRSWQDRHITIELTVTASHTIRRLNELYSYYQKPFHTGGTNFNEYNDDRIFAFPLGCRGKTGLKVLEGKSLRGVVGMTIEELQNIEGIGTVKAQSIYNHFNKGEESEQKQKALEI